MEEVDGLVLRALRNLGCDLEDAVKILKELTTEQTVEGIVRCLWQILPGCAIESFKLPPNMTAKFRMGTTIANAIKEAGYRGDVGYQTVLYGSEAEIRRILIFLIEKLPKEATLSSERELSAIDLTKIRGAQNIEESLVAPWTPWFCHRMKYRWDGRLWRPSQSSEDIRFRAVVGQFSDSGHLSSNANWKHLPASILEKTAQSSDTKVITLSTAELSLETMKMRIDEAQSDGYVKRARPKLPPKPKLLPKPKLDSVESDAEPVQELSEDQKKQQTEISALQELISALTTDINMVLEKMNQQKYEARQMKSEMEKLGKLEQRSEELTSIRKMATLLENPSESTERLQTFLEKSDARLAKLENQYAQHSLPKQQELAELRQGLGRMDKSEQLVMEMREMKSKAEEQTSEIEAKRAFLLQLQRELEKMSKGLNRSAYTRRILEIVANVRKQREQIDKTIEDTRGIQKEINMLTGKLERTFTAADELLFRDAKMDEVIRRAYKLVVNLHEKCGEIVKSVEETGQISREIQDLQDSIETESQKSTDANLEKLVNDYCEVKQENDNLAQRLKLLQT